jgi:hypothetical protein
MGGAKRRATQRAEIRDIAKEFPLVAQRVKREFAPGMPVNCWGDDSDPGWYALPSGTSMRLLEG